MELSKLRVDTIINWSEEKVSEYLAAVPSDFKGTINQKKEYILELEHASLNGSLKPHAATDTAKR